MYKRQTYSCNRVKRKYMLSAVQIHNRHPIVFQYDTRIHQLMQPFLDVDETNRRKLVYSVPRSLFHIDKSTPSICLSYPDTNLSIHYNMNKLRVCIICYTYIS